MPKNRGRVVGWEGVLRFFRGPAPENKPPRSLLRVAPPENSNSLSLFPGIRNITKEHRRIFYFILPPPPLKPIRPRAPEILLAILLARINHAERVERIVSPLGFSKRKLRLAGGKNSKLKPTSPRGFLLAFCLSSRVRRPPCARTPVFFPSLPRHPAPRGVFFQESSKDLKKGRRKEIDRGNFIILPIDGRRNR